VPEAIPFFLAAVRIGRAFERQQAPARVFPVLIAAMAAYLVNGYLSGNPVLDVSACFLQERLRRAGSNF
jgi:hypothetical protein